MPSRPVLFPVSLLLVDKACLVVGGRAVAKAKIVDLVAAGALVTVIAPEVSDEVAELPVTIVRREFLPGDTAGYHLAISATGDPDVDAAVHRDGAATRTLVNAADNPASCDFYLPAVLRRGDLAVAISTGGASPAVASWVRQRLAETIDDRFADVVELVSATRAAVRVRGRSSEGLPWGGLIDQLVAETGSGTELARCRALCDAWLGVVLEEPTQH